MKELENINKLPKLKKSQEILYKVLIERLNDELPIDYETAKNIYIENVCETLIDGKPAFFDYWGGERIQKQDGSFYFRGETKLMSDEMLKIYVINWLMRNIGALVLKGYLKVLPAISFNKLALNKLN